MFDLQIISFIVFILISVLINVTLWFLIVKFSKIELFNKHKLLNLYLLNLFLILIPLLFIFFGFGIDRINEYNTEIIEEIAGAKIQLAYAYSYFLCSVLFLAYVISYIIYEYKTRSFSLKLKNIIIAVGMFVTLAIIQYFAFIIWFFAT